MEVSRERKAPSYRVDVTEAQRSCKMAIETQGLCNAKSCTSQEVGGCSACVLRLNSDWTIVLKRNGGVHNRADSTLLGGMWSKCPIITALLVNRNQAQMQQPRRSAVKTNLRRSSPFSGTKSKQQGRPVLEMTAMKLKRYICLSSRSSKEGAQYNHWWP